MPSCPAKSPVSSAILALLIAFAIALPLAAADPAAKLPSSLIAEVSIKSPSKLLQAIDGYVAAATKKTRSQLPPGFLVMLSQLYLPLPMDTWNADAPAQILVLPATDTRDVAFVGVFGIKDFAHFVDSLQEYEWVLGESQKVDGYEEVRPVLLPNGKALTLANLGNGRAAVAENMEQINAVLDGGKWLPTHPSDADLAVRSDLKGDNRQFVQSIVKQLDEVGGKMETKMAVSGFSPEAYAGFGRLMREWVALAGKEIDKIHEAAFDLYVNPKQIAMNSGASFGPGSLMGEIASYTANHPATDTSLGERFPAGPLSVAVNCGANQIIPDAHRRISEFNAECVRKIFPELADEAAALNRRYFELNPGHVAVANYLKEGRQYNITLMQSNDPERAMPVLVESAGIIDKMLSEAVTDPRLKVQLVGQPQTDGNKQWWEFQAVFADAARWEEVVNGILKEGDETAVIPLRINANFRAFLAPVPGALALAVGELSNAEFRQHLEELQNKPAESLLEFPTVKPLLEALSPRQISVGVIDAAKAYQLFAAGIVQDMATVFGNEHSAPFRAVLEQMARESTADGNGLGFSLGSQDGRLTGRLVAPAAAVNTIIREHETFEGLRRNALRQMLEDQESQGVDALPPESLDEQGPEEDTNPMEVEEEADDSDAA